MHGQAPEQTVWKLKTAKHPGMSGRADSVLTDPIQQQQIQEQIQRALHCPAVIARLLTLRGIIDSASARRYLEPTLDDLHDPFLLLGMASAVDRIQQAVDRGEPILIYGDYDVDGTVATVLLKTAIERLAPSDRPAQVSYHVPHRLREGYGIQGTRLAQAAVSGVRLVISVDTGIRAFAAAAEAKTLGLDLIVTDHHLPDGSRDLPDALAVINPAQTGCSYPEKHLCGAGVAFKLAHALLASKASTPAEKAVLHTRLLPSFLKLVAIATIADSVELTGENRTIVWLGLRELRNPVQLGLRALMQVAKLPLDQSPTAMEIGFRLAPRINAAGRMDVASDVVELLLTRDPVEATLLAEKLDALNDDRRATEAVALLAIESRLLALRDASGRYEPQCIVLEDPAWHRGILGILASRVVDRTGRPALVLTSGNGASGHGHADSSDSPDGQAHGSGRSVAGFHLLDALTAVHTLSHEHVAEGVFTRFGGHAHAVGFSLPADRLDTLRHCMQMHSSAALTGELLTPAIEYDAPLYPSELTSDLCLWLERCAPFGPGNCEPLFHLRALTLSGPPRIIKESHLCLPLGVTAEGLSLNAMGWSRTHEQSWSGRSENLGLQAGSVIDAIVRLRVNKHPRYGGLEVDLVDLKLAEQ